MTMSCRKIQNESRKSGLQAKRRAKKSANLPDIAQASAARNLREFGLTLGKSRALLASEMLRLDEARRIALHRRQTEIETIKAALNRLGLLETELAEAKRQSISLFDLEAKLSVVSDDAITNRIISGDEPEGSAADKPAPPKRSRK